MKISRIVKTLGTALKSTGVLSAVSPALTATLTAGLVASGMLGTAQAQAPKYLITANTTLPTPAGFGGPNGNLATDKFGNLFVPNAAGSQVLEYPANGGPATVIFDATATKPQVSGVAVDSQNNLYVTTRYDGAFGATESDIFKFPYSSNGYPGNFTYTGSGAPVCSATSTNVCQYGNYDQTAGYYYQPQSIGYDAAGNGYMIDTYDSLNSAGGLTIYACNVACGQGTASATIVIRTLPTPALSLAVSPNGDLYWVDGKDVYYSPAGSGSVVLFDTFYESQYGGAAGVGFDRAGNLYVSNSAGTYEVSLIGGAIKAANRFQVAISTVGGYTGPAIDNNGNVFSAAYSTLLKSSLFNFNYGAVALGSTAPMQTFTIAFLTPGTISSLVAQQAGVPATEFPFSAGTCTPTATFAAGGTCTFMAGFAPAAVGTRRGTVVLTDTNGFQTNTYLIGVGQGTGFAVDPGTPTAVTTTLKAPSGLASDSQGNLFVADATAQTVLEYVGGTGTPVAIGSGYQKPTGVATDGGGNVYVVDAGAGTLQLFANNGGKFTTTGTVLASGLKAPSDVTVSGTGSVYVSNTGANTVVEFPNAARLSSLNASLSLGVNLSGPTGISLDPNGNLYVADTGNNRVVQLSYSGAQIAFGAGLTAPTGVAAEASGGVLIADQGNGRVVRVPSEAGVLTTADQQVISQPVLNPYSVRLTSAGNLFISDNTTGLVESLQRTAGTLNFGVSNVGATSAAQTIVVSSTGTADLKLASPFFTAPPTGSNFTLMTGSGSLGCTAGTLTSGRLCTLSSVFAPTSAGIKSYTAPLNTTAANAAGPSITLTGNGVQLVGVNVALTRTSPTGAVNYGSSVVFGVTVGSASAGSTAVPTGTVTFNVDGSSTKPVALVNGAASFTLTGLGGNTSHSVIATYSGNAVYASGNSTPNAFTVVPQTTAGVLTVFAPDMSPLSAAPPTSYPVTTVMTDPKTGVMTTMTTTTVVPGGTVSFSVVISPSLLVSGGLTGTVNFVSGSTVIPGTITQDSKSGVYSAGGSTTTLAPSCLAGETLPNCSNIYHFSAVFAGNGNYSGFTTPAQALVITLPTFSIVAGSNTINSTAAAYGSTTLTITSYSNYFGGVALTCSGLPANAYCLFRPGLISLSSVLTTPVSVTNPMGISTIPVQTTTMEIRVSQNPVDIQSASSFGVLGLISGVVMFVFGYRRKSLRGMGLSCLMGLVLAVGLGALSGCGANLQNFDNAYPTPAGSYPITLNAIVSPLTSGGQPPNVTPITQISSALAATPAPIGTTVPTTYTVPTVTLEDFNNYSGFVANELVTISGVTPAAYNGTFPIASTKTITVPAPGGVGQPTYHDEITYLVPAVIPGATSGGQIRPANLAMTQQFTLVVK